jgi:hypothetical protein
MPRRSQTPRATVEEQLAALDELPGDRSAQIAALAQALAAGHYRVAAKAARLAEEALYYELEPALLAAYARLLEKPLKQDPSCLAKKALARALVALDCGDVEFYLRGLRYRQLEPVWGGTTDTAADVRASCAMGLVASGYSRALVELTALLVDPEVAARIGAVRAIACGNPREAELVLRAKALAGDAEPQVVGECFTGLLSVAPEESLAFVAGYLERSDDAVRELAALALGESRHDAALAPLKEAWGDVLLRDELRRALVRAAAAHRSEAAFDWLLELVADARLAIVVEVVDALSIYRHNAKLRARLEAALAERGEPELSKRFAALWG